jgi:hypothetical protein
MTPIDEKVKEAWRGAQDIRRACADAHVVRLADALCHERAMRMKAEWFRGLFQAYTQQTWMNANGDCLAWTDADWQAQAEADLR